MKAFIADRVDACNGPTWSGKCPLSPHGEPVACAGQVITLADNHGRKVEVLKVEQDATTCPIAALGMTDP